MAKKSADILILDKSVLDGADHSKLDNLDYASAGHTGFSPDTHTHSHTVLTDKGTNTHAQIDTHIAGTGTAVHGDTFLLNTGDTGTGIYNFTGYLGRNVATPLFGVHNLGDGATSGTSSVIVSDAQKSGTIATQGAGAAYFFGRDTTNSIDFIMGTSTGGAAFAGSMTSHDMQLRARNKTRLIVKDSGNATTPVTINADDTTTFLGDILLTGKYLSSNVTTDATNKSSYYLSRHYTNAEEPVLGIVMTSSSAATTLRLGGGNASYNCATQVDIYAGATNTTTTGVSQLTATADGVGIKSSPVAYGALNLSPTVTDHTQTEYYVFNGYPFWRPTNDVAKQFFGAVYEVNIDSVNAVGNLTSNYYGGKFSALGRITAGVTANALYGGYFGVRNGEQSGRSGTVTNAYAGYFSNRANNSSVITNNYGIYVATPSIVSSGTMGTSTGLYIASQTTTGVTTGRAIYQAGTSDYNVFAAKSSFGTTTTPTATVSSNEKCAMNSDGGFMVKLTNKTGANSVKGHVVHANSAQDNSVIKVVDGVPDAIGVFYEDGVADGSEAWVVTSGMADVYFIGSTTRGHLARTFISGESGYVTGQALSEAVPSAPFASDKHFCEIGHVLASRTGAGLAKCLLHFN